MLSFFFFCHTVGKIYEYYLNLPFFFFVHSAFDHAFRTDETHIFYVYFSGSLSISLSSHGNDNEYPKNRRGNENRPAHTMRFTSFTY